MKRETDITSKQAFDSFFESVFEIEIESLDDEMIVGNGAAATSTAVPGMSASRRWRS